MAEPGKIINGKYEIEFQIGRGGFATVYKGKNLVLFDKPVAIKELRREYIENKTVLKMWQSEIQLSSHLEHNNIVKIYDTFKEGENYYVVFEYVDGPDLKKLISKVKEKQGRIPFHLSAYILSEVCNALDYAHNLVDKTTGMPLGIVHRDVSPQNILLDYQGQVKITDFGIAKAHLLDKEETHTGIVKGKYSYMSPEQIRCEPVDRTSDLYSLGIVLYELITNEKLFEDENDIILQQKVSKGGIDRRLLNRLDAPEQLKQILWKALQVDKSKRYQEAREIRQDLAKFLTNYNYENLKDDLSGFLYNVFRGETIEELEPTATVEGEAPQSVVPKEERTIIDAIKVATYSLRRFFASVAAAAVLILIVLLGLDTFLFQKTSLGRGIYNLIYPPLVEFKTLPPNAELFIDGKPYTKQRTPLKISRIKPGSYAIEYHLDGYQPIKYYVRVKDRKTLIEEGKKINTFLHTFEVPIVIYSDPPGAKIFINNEEYPGKTPITMKLPVSERNQKIRLEHSELKFNPLEGQINLLKDTCPKEQPFFSVIRENGSEFRYKIKGVFYTQCTLRVYPVDAKIIKIREGESEPISLTSGIGEILLGYGLNTINCTKEDFIPANETVLVKNGEPIKVDIELKRNVTVYAYDERTHQLIDDASVTIDKATYRTGRPIPVGARRRKVHISAKGYEPNSQFIDPVKSNKFSVKLKRAKPELELLITRGGIPVENAHIYLKRTGFGEFESVARTDNTGRSKIKIDEGDYDIKVEINGKTYSFENNYEVRWRQENSYEITIPEKE